MEQPREVQDEEYERVWERVAAIDVAKASGVVCTRVPDEDRPGRRSMHVWTVKATRAGAVTELGDHLRCQGSRSSRWRSTSDYWRIWYVVLEAAGLKVQLVNARTVKNVPGRAKTDKKDAVWLAKLTERGMLQPVVRAAAGHPAAAGVHPAARRPGARPGPVLGAAGKAAGTGADQDLRSGLHPGSRSPAGR